MNHDSVRGLLPSALLGWVGSDAAFLAAQISRR
jgi:hypothetical protein